MQKEVFIGLLIFLCLLFFDHPPGFPQENSKADSSFEKSLALNPTQAAKNDSSVESKVKPVNIGLESSVNYSADSIDFQNEKGITYLIGNATVKYKKMTISAGKITIFRNENRVVAEGIPDTTVAGYGNLDSLAIKRTGLPVFSDGKESMVGDKMEFNFKTERGRILRGRTQLKGAYYHGKAVKKVDANVFNVSDGVYTTCDKEEPHFHFRGKKMKVILDDKIVAKPVIFYLGKIPTAIFPFAMFSTKESGRQSGIIIPQYGSSREEGRYLRNLGYYWATNDYMDMRLTLDFFERTGILFRSRLNYVLRYNFTGSISGSYTRKDFDTRKERRWNLNVQHSQKIDPTTNLSVNASFVSNNSFFKEFSNNRSQRLNRQLRSNATFTRSWAEGKNSISVNLSQTKDLESGSERRTLPQIRFTRNQSAIFPFKKDERSKKEPSWYNLVRYSYRGFLVNSSRSDTTSNPDVTDRRAEHDLNFSYTNPKKLFGWLSWSQSLTYNEDWFDRRKSFTLVDSTNSFESTDDKGFAARHTFQYSTSANTNVFGTFNTSIGAIKAIRHKMTPSISFSYRPDFSDSFWGYFQSLTDTSGNEVRRDRFQGTPSGKLKSLGFGLTNLFQMKLADGEKEKKINLFNLNFRCGFNFAADSLKWQNFATSFRANPQKNLTISMNMSHSFYDFDQANGRTVDRFLLNEKGIFNSLRLTRIQFDARWNLSGRQKGSGQLKTQSQGQNNLPNQQIDTTVPIQGVDNFAPESAFSAFDIPWRATLSFSYSINRFNPLNPTRSAYIDLNNVQVQLTRNWRIGYRLRYDIERGDLVDQRLSFYRDLHCWEAQFNWSPSGISKGFYFKIGIKAGHLRAVKLERRGGSTTIFRPF